MKRPKFDMKGFTLAEIMVVVTVLGLLLAIGIPTMASFMRSTRMAGATNTLVADMHWARSQASAKRKTYQIAFGPKTYKIYQVAPPDTVRRRQMPRGVTCAATDTATFFAWGLADPVAITIMGGNDSTSVQVAANGSVSTN